MDKKDLLAVSAWAQVVAAVGSVAVAIHAI